MIKKLINEATECVDLYELIAVLESYDLYFNDDIVEDTAPANIEAYFVASEGELKNYDVIVHLFPTDDAVKEESCYDEIYNDCSRENWECVSDNIAGFYLIVLDEDGEELCGYKDFGLSEERFFELGLRECEWDDDEDDEDEDEDEDEEEE